MAFMGQDPMLVAGVGLSAMVQDLLSWLGIGQPGITRFVLPP
jgi:hypothetical protein